MNIGTVNRANNRQKERLIGRTFFPTGSKSTVKLNVTSNFKGQYQYLIISKFCLLAFYLPWSHWAQGQREAVLEIFA